MLSRIIILYAELLLLSSLFFAFARGQFPTVCMENATLPMAVCCPTPEGSQEVCGGSSRGACVPIEVVNDSNSTRWLKLPKHILQDDRLHWPLRFFTYACKCLGNFAGASCEKCSHGYEGANCDTPRKMRVRRNVWSLNATERRLFRDIIHASKSTPSGWSSVSVSGPESSDPVTREKLHYVQASVYDFWVHFHYYAARSTMLSNGMHECSTSKDHVLDYAHRGPGFLPWHRGYLLELEDAFAKIAKEQFGVSDFSLIYWDWTDAWDCPICTNELIGDFYNPNVTLSPSASRSLTIPRTMEEVKLLRETEGTVISPSSPISLWRTMCSTNSSNSNPCFYCDLHTEKYLHEKRPFLRAYNNHPIRQRFANQAEMDQVLRSLHYDDPPFDFSSSNRSFRNALEGFTNIGERLSPDNTHNLAHIFFLGTALDRTTSPNDPFFLFHHTFIDKVWELWMQAQGDAIWKYPEGDMRYGHQAQDFMLPSFPPVTNGLFFQSAAKLGYQYDDYLVGTTTVAPASDSLLSSFFSWYSAHPVKFVCVLLVLSLLLGLSIAGLTWAKIRKRHRIAKNHPHMRDYVGGTLEFHEDEQRAEAIPLLLGKSQEDNEEP